MGTVANYPVSEQVHDGRVRCRFRRLRRANYWSLEAERASEVTPACGTTVLLVTRISSVLILNSHRPPLVALQWVVSTQLVRPVCRD
jgi:hypothetical protein